MTDRALERIIRQARRVIDDWLDSPEGRAQNERVIARIGAQAPQETDMQTEIRHMTAAEIAALESAPATGQFFSCSARRLPPQLVSVRYSPTADGHWMISLTSCEGRYTPGMHIPTEDILYTGSELNPSYIVDRYVRSLGHSIHGVSSSLAGSPVDGWLHDRD